ncbi:Alpha/Beta hydrolase protein [Spinellus fusiger]|nr:Alpha/Beta hydrolase protein [Spinellus fusiger]
MLEKYNPESYNHQYCTVNGIRMHYIDENPSSNQALMLIHGWPDLWFGWREQIHFLVELGYRVIVPTPRGIGETDAPEDPNAYNCKEVCNDFVKLLDFLELPTVTMIGHDWGGFFALKFALFYPERTKAVTSFCTPYIAAGPVRLTLEQIVQGLPSFGYQLYLITPEATKELDTYTRDFFNVAFRPTAEITRLLVDPTTTKIVEGREKIARSEKVPEAVMDYYVKTYQKSGFRGSLNWYKQMENNWELLHAMDQTIKRPTLITIADKDRALPMSMAVGMESFIPDLEKHTVEDSGHWILWEQPEQCNKILTEWLIKQNIVPTHA